MNNDKETAAVAPLQPTVRPDALTPEQTENWRRVLLTTLGPYALIMSVADIQRYRDSLQAIADAEV